jgi:hypothetical protein
MYAKRPREQVSIFFGRDRGMVLFLAFLVVTTTIVPMITLSQMGRIGLSVFFAITTIFGAFATIHHRFVIYLAIGLSLATIVVDLIAETRSPQGSPALDPLLKVAGLSILVFMTLKRTLRPGPVTAYRVAGGIAGYLLIGLMWTFAYQFLVQQVPGAIRFEAGTADPFSRQPSHLVYFSFITLCTVGYGDAHPVHTVARSLAVAEALVGQLYIAILIASLVGMALQERSAKEAPANTRARRPPH